MLMCRSVFIWVMASSLLAAPVPSKAPRVADVLAGLPLHFEPVGDTLVARMPGYTITLGADGAHFVVPTLPHGGGREMTLRLKGGRNVVPQAREKMAGVSNYLYGSDPRGWRTSVANYAR